MFSSMREFKAYCNSVNLPLNDMRFAIGEDKGTEPKWFYIYKDTNTGEYVVAKNKADGTKVERYRGYSEYTAVEILEAKMEEEANRRGLTIYTQRVQDEAAENNKELFTTPKYLYENTDESEEQLDYQINPNNHRRFRRESRHTAKVILAIILASITVPILCYAAIKLTLYSTQNFGRHTIPNYSYNDSSRFNHGDTIIDNTIIDNDPYYYYDYDYGYDYDYDDYDYDYDDYNGYSHRYNYDDYDYGYDDYDYNYDYDYDDYDYDYDWGTSSSDSDWSWDSWDSGSSDWDSSWDSDSGWDSWDSGSSDWDSDW